MSNSAQKPHRTIITEEVYDRLVEAFRKHGPSWAPVSRETGLNKRTVAKAWRQGWPGKNMDAISALMRAEQSRARELVRQEARESAEKELTAGARNHVDRAKLGEDAAQSRAQEASMIRLLRADVTGALASVAQMLPGMQQWAKQANLIVLQQGKPKSVQEASRLMESAARIVERIANAADKVMAMERRLLGEPETIIGHALPDITLEEAVHYIDVGNRMVQRAKARGLLPGGEPANGNDGQSGQTTTVLDVTALSAPDGAEPH